MSLLALGVTRAHAFLGATEEECAKLYGKPQPVIGYLPTEGEFAGMSIIVRVHEGKVWDIEYSGEGDKPLSDELTARVLGLNSERGKPLEAAGFAGGRTQLFLAAADGSRYAFCDEERPVARFVTRERMENLRMAAGGEGIPYTGVWRDEKRRGIVITAEKIGLLKDKKMYDYKVERLSADEATYKVSLFEDSVGGPFRRNMLLILVSEDRIVAESFNDPEELNNKTSDVARWHRLLPEPKAEPGQPPFHQPLPAPPPPKAASGAEIIGGSKKESSEEIITIPKMPTIAPQDLEEGP